MAPNDTGLLPGQSAPLTVITSTDQSGVVLIATSLGLGFAIISILLRIFIRLEFRNQIAKDDVLAFVAMVFAVLQSSAVFIAVSKGFGKTLADIPPDDVELLQKALYSSNILYLFTLWLTKCSVAFLFLRLSPKTRHVVTANIILTTSTIMMITSILIVALRCNLSHPWIVIGTQCTGLLTRWDVVAAFDIVTEIALFAASFYMVIGLQLSLENKSLVISAFGLRIPILVPIVLRLYYLGFTIPSPDPTLRGVMASVFTQIQMNFAILATTTPCLRPFMKALSTNYGAPSRPQTATIGSKKPGLGGSFSLSSLSKSLKMGSAAGGKDVDIPATRWDSHVHHVAVMLGDQHSLESHESRKNIISKNTEWTVEYEDLHDNH